MAKVKKSNGTGASKPQNKEITAPPFVPQEPQLKGKGVETLISRARALVAVQDIWNRSMHGEFPGPMQDVCRGARDWLKKQK